MRNYLKAAMPFSALGFVFVILGLVLADSKHMYFGLVWFFIAVITVIWKRKNFNNNS